MAGKVIERLIIEIGGDAKKFKNELKSLRKANKSTEASFQKFVTVGKAGFLAVAAAAAAFGVASTKAFISFEKGVTNVAKTTDLAGKDLEEFKKEIMDLGEEIPQTTDQLLQIATAAGQLGIKGVENLTIFTETIAKLGATTDLEGDTAAIAIARILNLTNESIQSVDQFGSTIVDLGNNFATSESQILELATEVAKATINFKLASPEILGISAAMSSLGIEAEAGSTVVGKAFAAIDVAIRSQGGPAFEKLMELTGMTGEELTRVFQKDAELVFQSFIKGLGDSAESGKSMRDELHQLGLSGIRVEKILPTLAERSDILKDALDRAGEAAKNNSALNDEAAKAFATSASKLQIAQNKINNVLIEVGANIAPEFAEAMGSVSDVVKENSEAFTALGTLLGFLVKVLGFIVVGIGYVVEVIITDLKLARNNIEDFTFFIVGLWLTFWKATENIFNNVIDKIFEFADIISQEFNKIKGNVQEKVIKYFMILKDISTKIFKDISKKAEEWVASFREKTKPVEKIVNDVIGVFIGLSEAAKQVFDRINEKTDSFVSFFTEKINQIQDLVSSVTPDFLKFGDTAEAGTVKAKESVEENSKSIIERITDLIKKYRDVGKEWINTDAEVTAKTTENKNKRVQSQNEETESVKNNAQERQEAVVRSAEETKKQREQIEMDRIKRMSELNALELQILNARNKNLEKSEIDALQAKFSKLQEINAINNQITRLKAKENLTKIEQQTLEHLQIVLQLKEEAKNREIATLEEQLEEIRKGEKSKQQIIEQGILEREKARVKEHNQRLKDEVEFGQTMASIKAMQRSAEYQGTKNAASELAVLINSENDNLKAIGKAATIVQIGISTAESAMKAYAGLAWIPVVGFGLGILAASALTAYGAEQINNVRKMQDGGIVPGVGRGDKVPALLEPGELVVPRDVTAELMKKLGTRQMADGGMATGAKESKALYQTFAEMFNPATFIRALVYEYLGWGSDSGEGADSASGFGAGLFGGIIGGMINIAEGSVKELAKLLLDQLPGGEFIQKIAEYAQIPKEALKDIIKDIVGEGPLYQFLEELDSSLSSMLFDGFIKANTDILGFITGFGGHAGDIISDIGGGLGFQNGGIVPGNGRGDIVPAFLEPGELVVPRNVTSSLLNISSGIGTIKTPSIPQSVKSTTGQRNEPLELVITVEPNEMTRFISAKQREQRKLGISAQ